MPLHDDITAALAATGKGRATLARLDGDTADIVLDVTGLDPAAADRLETDIQAAVAPLAALRLARTAERRTRRLVAVASGKGGVGKSTVAANLALGLKARGIAVGLVDADIYGPSQPRLLAAEALKPRAEDKQLIPVVTAQGLPMLSMGQLVPPGQAIAWRGPMATGALGQLLDARWEGVDTLVVDLPPGTGDVQLAMIQKHRPAGALIVSTPQDLALIDATRAIDLFRKADVPLIGLVENMAGYACPHCGELSDPFGRGGAEAAARDLGLPFLGRVPLAAAIRAASDEGRPDPAPFAAITDAVAAWLNPSGSPRF